MGIRLTGHELIFEGAPHDAQGRRIGFSGTGGEGRGRCSCGALSEVLASSTKRRGWHRDVHKAEIRKQQEGS